MRIFKKNYNKCFLLKARAKIEMRKTCTKRDALEVIEIMKSSMVDTFDNELGLLDVSINRSQFGDGSARNSKSAQIKDFVAILQSVSEKKKSLLFSTEDIKEIYEVLHPTITNILTLILLIVFYIFSEEQYEDKKDRFNKRAN